MTTNLEYVPGDNLVKQFIPVDPAEHPKWMSTWSDSSYSVDNVFTEEELIKNQNNGITLVQFVGYDMVNHDEKIILENLV